MPFYICFVVFQETNSAEPLVSRVFFFFICFEQIGEVGETLTGFREFLFNFM